MRYMIWLTGLAGVCALLCLTGCEWTTGGGVESWVSAGYDWANFSGTYRSPDGKVLVREFGVNTGEVGNITVTNSSRGEYIGEGDGVTTEFSAVLDEKPIPGTLTIIVGSYRFTDSSANTGLGTYNLAVTPADGSSGTISYGTHVVTLKFPAPIDIGTEIEANYMYLEDEQHAGQGNHGEPIYSFVVYQTGNSLQLVDSNGDIYKGSIGDFNTTGGEPYDPNDSSQSPPTTGNVFAQFSVSGTANGYNVTIAGTFSGTLNNRQLTSRTMQATFVEHGGYEADINAAAAN